MAMFSVRVPDQLAQRFDAVADAHGGRSAHLRQLISSSASPGKALARTLRQKRDGARIMVRLTARDAAAVDREAAAMALSRASWVAALVHNRVRGAPRFSRAGELSLVGIQAELRRIGVNVNQIARALNTAVLEGRVLDLELRSIEDARLEIRAHILALRDVLDGNQAYWATAS